MAKAEYRSAVRSRKLIKEALADLLQEKPLDKITVTDVVRRADINRGTFYAHYADIPDVIDHLIQETFSQIWEVLNDHSGSIETVPGLMLRRVQEFMEEDIDFYRKVMTSSASRIMQERLISLVLDYMSQHESEYHIENHEQFLLMMRFCAGGLTNLYIDWFAGKVPYTFSALTAYSEQLLTGVILFTRRPPNT